MNTKRFIIASISVFVTFLVLDFLVHGVILSGTYAILQGVWRSDMNRIMWMMYLATFVFSFVFTWLFVRGYRKGEIMEGLVFGLVMGTGMNIMAAMGQYVMYPLPGAMCVKWFIFGTIEYCFAGIIASTVYSD